MRTTTTFVRVARSARHGAKTKKNERTHLEDDDDDLEDDDERTDDDLEVEDEAITVEDEGVVVVDGACDEEVGASVEDGAEERDDDVEVVDELVVDEGTTELDELPWPASAAWTTASCDTAASYSAIVDR